MFDLDRFIADCRAALATSSPAAAVGAIVDRALAAPAEVEAALGSPLRGGLFTLHHSPELTILNVVWASGMAIYPHEHRMWAVIGLYGGREDNTFYRRDARGLAVAGGKRLERSETALLDEAIIHGSDPRRRRRFLWHATQRVGAGHARGAPVRRGARQARVCSSQPAQ